MALEKDEMYELIKKLQSDMDKYRQMARDAKARLWEIENPTPKPLKDTELKYELQNAQEFIGRLQGENVQLRQALNRMKNENKVMRALGLRKLKEEDEP